MRVFPVDTIARSLLTTVLRRAVRTPARAHGSAVAVLASILLPPVVFGQDVAFWDVADFDQPGQRSLFLRTPSGGTNGLPLGAGDANGDSREEPLLCAFNAGEAWLFLSPTAISGIREAVPAANEVVLIAGAERLGVECAQGDVNGDGLDDLILGAPAVDVGGRLRVGAVFVVFGRATWPASIDVSQPGQALAIQGEDTEDHFGVWVDAADIDGDGAEEILIGAPDADGPANDRMSAGAAHVVFGGTDLGPGVSTIAALSAAGRVFTAHGADPFDGAGSALAAGRIDAGAVGDFVVGSALNRAAQPLFNGGLRGGDGPDESRSNAGETAVVFNVARGGAVDLRSPSPDVAIVYGADAGDFAGEELDAGDADGDGIDDLLIGALTARGFDDLRPGVGDSYLVYGGDALHGARIDLENPPAGVTTFFGPTAGGITGDTGRFIDVDGDGREDPFLGSPTGTFLGPDDRVRTGALFFLRSPAGRLPAVIQLDQPPLDLLPFGVVLAADPGDILSYSLTAIDADGDGRDDVLVNGMTGSGLNNQFPNAGEAYVIEGEALAAALRPFADGDVNGDGDVNLADLQRVIAALVGRVTLSPAERGEADTNGNGSLDEGDVPGMLDRVFDRNALVSGIGAGSARIKPSESPPYRYGSPGDGGGHNYGAAFSLERVDGGAQPLKVLRAVFRVAAGQRAPTVVAGAARVASATVGRRLVVLALADSTLPSGVPLFELRGATPKLLGARGVTPGGSLRPLAPAAGAQPAAPRVKGAPVR